MKNNLKWLAITAVYMVGIPFLFMQLTGESAWAFAFLFFYALNPLFCVVAGIFAGLNIKTSWVICLMPTLLFLLGVLLFYDIHERIFYTFAAVYLIISVLCMLFVARERRK